ncbi:MAG: type I-U CRISPR-associated helicase/endonuclease Cas3, partial [Acidimicrobiia bacterium]|nr:type I-U CRISPR-associated helicase/endonuclease Cas3 [Acidimicrobiia bacterium]
LRRIGSAAGAELAVPLVVAQMRGGVTWESRWVARPDQPAVVVGTVDQLGSRLLFRGYGLSDRMKPIDAALFGTDTLLILDEAHLSDALVETIGGIARLEHDLAERPLVDRSLRTVSMTATPRLPIGEQPLVTDDDRNDAVAEPRLSAVKWARLVDLEYAAAPGRAATDVGRAMASTATDLVRRTERSCGVVLVVANTIALARTIHGQLNETAKAKAKAPFDVELVVGRCRAIEREANRSAWWERVRSGRERGADTRPLILVATQTVEVGVDLDVDALVTEAAPIDALVQRFGRVDRLGTLGETESFVVHAPGRLVEDAPPYGEASARTWAWLVEEAGGAACFDRQPVGGEFAEAPSVDFGLLALRDRLDAAESRAMLFSTAARPPIVLPEIVSVWRRTSPIPSPDEGVASFLHGISRGSPSVSVAWRADLRGEIKQDRAVLRSRPPLSGELVEVTLASFRRFLRGAEPAPGESDLESAPSADDPPLTGAPAEMARAWVRRGQDWEAAEQASDVRPGDVIFVASDDGGHDRYGWTGERNGSTVDVADLVASRRPTLRLDARVLAPMCAPVTAVGDDETTRSAATLLGELRDGVQEVVRRAGDADETADTCVKDFLRALREIAAADVYGTLLRNQIDKLEKMRWSISPSANAAFVEVTVDDHDKDLQDRSVKLARLVGELERDPKRRRPLAVDDD